MALEKDTRIKVTNRDNGSVGYIIPDLGNLHRDFASGETKEITFEELEKLSYIPGGRYILENLLVIHNPEAVAEILNAEMEPEYYYSEEDVRTLLLEGTLDQLKDCLEFAPEGTINLVKNLAVELKLNDIAKRDTILKETGFNVDNAIKINKESEEETATEAPSRTRRSQPIQTSEKKAERRSATTINSKYKIVSK